MSRSHVCIIALASAALGCSDSSAPKLPALPREEIAVSLCDDETWFAYQNEREAWTRGIPVGGVVTFEATTKLTVAIASVRSSTSNVSVLQLTAEQLDSRTCQTSVSAGTKTLNGMAAGLRFEEFADVALGHASSIVFANGGYSVSAVAAGPLDLLAARRVSLEMPHVIDRLVIYRDVDLPNNATLPTVDFSASDAFASVNMLVTHQGRGSSQLRLENTFISSRGSSLHLFDEVLLDPLAPSSFPVYSVPAARQVAGDLHELHLQTYSSSDRRDVYLMYAAPGPKTLTLGPPVAAPIVTTVATSPYRRLAIESASNPMYAAMAAAFVFQSSRSWNMIVTKEFLGSTPATWTLTMPDLAAVDGFEASWALQAGSYDLLLEQAEGRFAAILGGPGIDGDLLRFGSYESSTSNSTTATSTARLPRLGPPGRR